MRNFLFKVGVAVLFVIIASVSLFLFSTYNAVLAGILFVAFIASICIVMILFCKAFGEVLSDIIDYIDDNF